MFSILELPIIPILSLLVIIPIVVWQTYSFRKERTRNRIPIIPQLNTHKQITSKKKPVQNATMLNLFRLNRKPARHSSFLFTSLVAVFVIINLVVVSYYLRNRKITYLPRASTPVTPTLIAGLNPLSTNVPSPTSVPTSTTTPTITVTPTQLVNKPTVTSVASPTLIARVNPINQPTLRLSTPTPIPTKIKPTSQSQIPVAGPQELSWILTIGSLLLLAVGFIL